MIKTMTTATLMMVSLVALAAESSSAKSVRPHHDIVCTPTLNSAEQVPFSVQPKPAQSDISNLEEMTQDFSYGNIKFKVAFDTNGNYRIRCNLLTPYTELLIAQGRLPRNDRLFIDIANGSSTSSARIRLECIESGESAI